MQRRAGPLSNIRSTEIAGRRRRPGHASTTSALQVNLPSRERRQLFTIMNLSESGAGHQPFTTDVAKIRPLDLTEPHIGELQTAVAAPNVPR
jgi:hypothetical protein